MRQSVNNLAHFYAPTGVDANKEAWQAGDERGGMSHLPQHLLAIMPGPVYQPSPSAALPSSGFVGYGPMPFVRSVVSELELDASALSVFF